MNTHMNLFKVAYANNNDALVPEKWANEGLAVLMSEIVCPELVYRDYSPMIASNGDVVNLHLPSGFTVKRKVDTDDITVQDATLTNIPVTLNQHLHVSFTIKDGERSKAFKDLVQVHLVPAMQAIAEGLNKILACRTYDFIANSYGQLQTMASSESRTYMLGIRKVLNDNKCPTAARFSWLSTDVESKFLDTDLFTAAEKVGDSGTALRTASLGQKLGATHFMTQAQPYVALASCAVITGAVNLSAGYAIGTTSLAVDGLSAAITAGTYVTFVGSMYPHRIVSTTGGGTPTAMVITPGLKGAVANDAVLTLYSPVDVNLSAGYALGWAKAIAFDGGTSGKGPQVGQLIADAAGNTYGIIEVTGTGDAGTITLDHPLEAALTNDQEFFLGPAGSYSFFGVSQAIALISRPLALPEQGVGVKSAIAEMSGIALRATIGYSMTSQGHIVTLDLLCGTETLNTNLGGVLLS